MAVIRGLQLLNERCRVTVMTDSQYVMNAFEKGWMLKWKANGWRTADKKPVKNQELWEELADAVERHAVSWEWVKGHSGNPDNERVDEAARLAAEQIERSGPAEGI